MVLWGSIFKVGIIKPVMVAHDLRHKSLAACLLGDQVLIMPGA